MNTSSLLLYTATKNKMLYCLLTFSALLLKPNIIFAAGAGNEFPRYLSFVEYKSILSFANDEAGESDIGILNALNTNNGNSEGPKTWDDFVERNGWNLAEMNHFKALKPDFSQTKSSVTPPLYPFVICHVGTSSLCGRERHDVIDSMLSKKNEEYFLELVPIYNHKRQNLDEKRGEEEKAGKKTISMAPVSMRPLVIS